MTMPSGWAGGNSTVFSSAGEAQAWVNFNGTGTVAIRGSFNVSSITDGGPGIYTVNFTTALVDANYSCVATCSAGASNGNIAKIGSVAGQTTSGVLLFSATPAALQDADIMAVSIFR